MGCSSVLFFSNELRPLCHAVPFVMLGYAPARGPSRCW